MSDHTENRLYFATEFAFPMEKVWPALDFPAPGWTIKGGGPREVGSLRSTEMPELGLIVDRLLAYSDTPEEKSFTYALINEDNFMGVKGWEGTLRLFRNSADPNRCFYVYRSRWDSAEKDVHAMFTGLMTAMMDQIVAGLEAAEA